MHKLNGQRVKFRLITGRKIIILGNYTLAEAIAEARNCESITPGVSLFCYNKIGSFEYVNFNARPERRDLVKP